MMMMMMMMIAIIFTFLVVHGISIDFDGSGLPFRYRKPTVRQRIKRLLLKNLLHEPKRKSVNLRCFLELKRVNEFFRELSGDPIAHYRKEDGPILLHWFSHLEKLPCGEKSEIRYRGLLNPYDDLKDGQWVKSSFHAHRRQGTEKGQLPSVHGDGTNIIGCYQHGFRCINVVANDEWVTKSYTKDSDTFKMLIMNGIEYRLNEASGPHISMVKGYDEFTTICHPSLPIPALPESPDEPQHDNTPTNRFLNHHFEGIRFMEVANGWMRSWEAPQVEQKSSRGIPTEASINTHTKSNAVNDAPLDSIGRQTQEGSIWKCEPKWDTLLSSGVLLWGTGEDDAFQRFGKGVSDDAILRRKKFESFPGFVWNEVFIKNNGDQKQLDHNSLSDAMLNGRFYFTTGVMIRDIRFEDGVLTVESENADEIILSTNVDENKISACNPDPHNAEKFLDIQGEVLQVQKGSVAKFRVWDLLDEKAAVVPRPTYVRVTLKYDRVHVGQGREYAYTQPFWLTVGPNKDGDGATVLARDVRQFCTDNDGELPADLFPVGYMLHASLSGESKDFFGWMEHLQKRMRRHRHIQHMIA